MKWLARLVAGDELATLERYRVACQQAERWNASIPVSAATAEWVRQVGEGERGFDIERFRERLRRIAAASSSEGSA